MQLQQHRAGQGDQGLRLALRQRAARRPPAPHPRVVQQQQPLAVGLGCSQSAPPGHTPSGGAPRALRCHRMPMPSGSIPPLPIRQLITTAVHRADDVRLTYNPLRALVSRLSSPSATFRPRPRWRLRFPPPPTRPAAPWPRRTTITTTTRRPAKAHPARPTYATPCGTYARGNLASPRMPSVRRPRRPCMRIHAPWDAAFNVPCNHVPHVPPVPPVLTWRSIVLVTGRRTREIRRCRPIFLPTPTGLSCACHRRPWHSF